MRKFLSNGFFCVGLLSLSAPIAFAQADHGSSGAAKATGGGASDQMSVFLKSLPRLYREQLQKLSVSVSDSSTGCQAQFAKGHSQGNPKSTIQHPRDSLSIKVSSQCDLVKVKAQIVSKLTEEIMKDNKRCASTDALWNTKDEVLLKKENESDENLASRESHARMKSFDDKIALAKSAAVEALVHRTPASASKDTAARIWFETRLNDDPNSLSSLLKPEFKDNKLVMMQTWGLEGFGHATLGFVKDPRSSEDASGHVLNPGSFIWEDEIKIKNKNGEMANPTTLQLMRGIKDENGNDLNPNEVRALDFFGYVDNKTINAKVPLNVDTRVAEKISTNQKVVLQTLIERPPFKGSFRMVRNNCAHGARDIYNTMLPVDACPNLPGIAILPKRVLEGYSKVFGVEESFNVVPGKKLKDVWKQQK